MENAPEWLDDSWVLVGKWLDEFGQWESDFDALSDIEIQLKEAETNYIDIPWIKLIGQYKIVQGKNADLLRLEKSSAYLDFETIIGLFAPVREHRVSFDQGAPGGNGVFIDYYTKRRTAKRLAQYLKWTTKRIEIFLNGHSTMIEVERQAQEEAARRRVAAQNREEAARSAQMLENARRQSNLETAVRAAVNRIVVAKLPFAAAEHVLLHQSMVAMLLAKNRRGYKVYQTPETVYDILETAGFEIIPIEEYYPEDMGHVFILARGSAIGWLSRINLLRALEESDVNVSRLRASYQQWHSSPNDEDH